MQSREITVNELQTNIDEIGDIEQPIIVRRKDKKDFVIVDLEEYQKNIFFSKLEKSKQDYKNGKFKNAREVFSRLEEKYGY